MSEIKKRSSQIKTEEAIEKKSNHLKAVLGQYTSGSIPNLLKKEKKNSSILVRISQKEKILLENFSESIGSSISNVIRMAIKKILKEGKI